VRIGRYGTGEELRVTPARRKTTLSTESRLRMFDDATRRQAGRKKKQRSRGSDRGWTREDLYDRGRTR
jgi:hypothetical protein